jgi:hypothetical protein
VSVPDDSGHQPVHAQRCPTGGVGDDRPAGQTLNPIIQRGGIAVGERDEQRAGDPVRGKQREHTGEVGELRVGVDPRVVQESR